MAGAYRRGVTRPVRRRVRRRRDPDAHGAVEVGAMHPYAEAAQCVDGDRRGMAVVVVGPDADQRHLRVHGGEERQIGRGRAVVRDREQVRLEARPARVGGRAGLQVGLRRPLRVAGEQRPSPRPGGPHDQGAVVRLAVGVPVRPSRAGSEHRQLDVADDRPVTGHRRADRDLPFGGEREHLGHPGHVRLERAQPDRVDADGAHHLGHAAEVVGVGVGHHEQVEAATAVGAQPACGALVAAGVDEDPRPRGLEQVGVALADVDGGHGQLRRQPPPDHHRRHSCHDQQHARQARDA
ncbi:MAG TPA: hypothetical protein VK906_01160 [Egicoccus sp.]|nr:hypothetical protein [Egicoccus sp.]HSK21748.1 hypothetical protein [Egicoccus sp.]